MNPSDHPRSTFALRFASVGLCVLTFILIVWGGHVNTTQSGMAFPDWPTSNNEAMLTYKPSEWLAQNDRFWEHSHRLLASCVGLLTVIVLALTYRMPGVRKAGKGAIIVDGIIFLIVATAITGIQRMPPGFMEAVMSLLVVSIVGFSAVAFRKSGLERAHWLAHAAFSTVCLQACFGGYTVRNNLPAWTSTTHGMLAEVFMMMVLGIALLVSKNWQTTTDINTTLRPSLRNVIIGTWVLTLVQFLLGALTRHTHAWGVSQNWPMWNDASFWPSQEELQVFQVVVHILHRTTAYIVAAGVIVQWYMIWKRRSELGSIVGFSTLSAALVILQIWLGVQILLSGREEIVTTLHVMTGALMLTVNSMILFTGIHRYQKHQQTADNRVHKLAGQGS